MDNPMPPWGDEPIFEWDTINETHIWEKHGVTVFEVEECFDSEYRYAVHRNAEAQPEKFAGRYIVWGITNINISMVIIIRHCGANLIRPITAWRM